MLPIKKIYVDTRFKSSDSRSDSDFKIDLPTTLLMPDDTGFYIDDVCIPHTWYTVEANVNDKLHYKFNTLLKVISIPEGNYNATNLGVAIVAAMNKAQGVVLPVESIFYNAYDSSKNALSIYLAPQLTSSNFEIFTDTQLKAMNSSASGSSLNTLIKNFTSKGYNNSPFISGYIDMIPRRNLYLCCSGLGNFNTMTLNGNRNVVKKIPVNANPGEMIFDQTVTGMDYLDCSGQTLSRISFQLKDAYGNVINLHGNHFSFSLVFSRVQDGT